MDSSYFKQPSTWVGIVVLLAGALGVDLEPSAIETAVNNFWNGVVMLGGLFEIIRRERQ